MGKVLIYNNRTGIADRLRPYLAGENLEAVAAETVEELQVKLNDEEILLLLLDVELGTTGWDKGIELIGCLREKSRIPLLVISDQTAETAIIMALEAGADDYLCANCNPLEMIARINSQIRRYKQLVIRKEEQQKIFRVGELVVDDVLHRVTVEGRNVRLTPLEYDILRLLVQKPGKVLSNSQIYESIWKMKAYGADNIIAVHVRHIREKIEINPKEPRYLKVVWGSGYKVG